MEENDNDPKQPERILMTESSSDQVEMLLDEIQAGNEQAKEQLFEHVHGELHRIAHCQIKDEAPSHSWGSTDLVHEAFLQLSHGKQVFTKNRAYFFGAAAQAMRQLLQKRATHHKKHHRNRVVLDYVLEQLEGSCGTSFETLHLALEQLKAMDPRAHEVVMLRFFGGLSWKEIAEHLHTSISTAEKDWNYARAWLKGELKGERT